MCRRASSPRISSVCAPSAGAVERGSHGRSTEVNRSGHHRLGGFAVGNVDHAARGMELVVGQHVGDRVDR